MSEIHKKPEIESRRTGGFRLFGLFHPVLALLVCLGIIIAGICINYLLGISGTMTVVKGMKAQEIYSSKKSTGQTQKAIPVDISVILDSLKVAPHVAEYEIQLWREDTISSLTSYEGMPSSRVHVASFPLIPMEIHEIPGSDFRFRLSEFYPNFSFSYSYPDNIDTIPPRAPGVMLDLKTSEGDAFVTLRTDQPNKSTLADLVGLGATLEFYWEIPGEIAELTNNPGTINRILFAGKERMVYFVIDGKTEARPLGKGVFYEIPGKQNIGFSMRYLFQDAAYLKATPSSLDEQVLNPVAQIQVWKEGAGYQEFFLYPGRKAGVFGIPETPYALVLDVSQKQLLQFCQPFITVEDSHGEIRKYQLTSNKSESFGGYKLRPAEYNPESPDQLGLAISRRPGNFLVYCGGGLLLIFLVLTVASKGAENSGRTKSE